IRTKVTMKTILLFTATLLLGACAVNRPPSEPGISGMETEALIDTGCGDLLDDYETFSLMAKAQRRQTLRNLSDTWGISHDNCGQLRLALLLSHPEQPEKDRQQALKLLRDLLTGEKLQDPRAHRLARLVLDQLQQIRAQKLKALELRQQLKAQQAATRELSAELAVLQSQMEQLKNIEQNINEKERYIRCQPWRAKRRLVDPSSREAALLTRRAHSARGEAK
uniref:hypothetical protein n=4 Tax=Thiolapillus sp. TaxID=2017437 RepID=UPI003AF52B7C